VFGTRRRPSAGELPGVEMLVLDVREDASVDEAVRSVLHRAARIDVLGNDASYLLKRRHRGDHGR
jgi:NADP-dependent 3-hydroxy acid dehydrogenase YdfG